MLHMDPRFISHNFGYPVQHSQYYSHPSFWTPQHHMPYGPSSLNTDASHQSAFSVPIKRERSDGEESNRSSDSELSDEDEQGSSNEPTFLPHAKAIDCVIPGSTRDTYHAGLITSPDSSASASPNTSLDSVIGSKSPEDASLQVSAMFPPIYTPLSSYQPANFIKPVPVNNFPLNLQMFSTKSSSDTFESAPEPLTQTTCELTQLTFPMTQMITIQPVSQCTSPSSDSQISPESITSTPSPVSLSSATEPEVKKTRTCYTARQLQTLERMFLENPYPDGEVIDRLSDELDVGEKKLKIWFQNKRARTRRRMQQYGPAAGALPMMPGTGRPPPALMTRLPTPMTPASTQMPYGFPMPTSHSLPGGVYHPQALQFASSQHAFPFLLSQGTLPFPPSQHGMTHSFQTAPTIKTENTDISPSSQHVQHQSSRSPIPFYHRLPSPTVTQDLTKTIE